MLDDLIPFRKSTHEEIKWESFGNWERKRVREQERTLSMIKFTLIKAHNHYVCPCTVHGTQCQSQRPERPKTDKQWVPNCIYLLPFHNNWSRKQKQLRYAWDHANDFVIIYLNSCTNYHIYWSLYDLELVAFSVPKHPASFSLILLFAAHTITFQYVSFFFFSFSFFFVNVNYEHTVKVRT